MYDAKLKLAFAERGCIQRNVTGRGKGRQVLPPPASLSFHMCLVTYGLRLTISCLGVFINES